MPERSTFNAKLILLGVALVALAVVSVQAVLRIERILAEDEAGLSDSAGDASPSSVDGILRYALESYPSAIRTPAAAIDPALNIVDPELLAPHLLDDREEIARYLEAFPADRYQVAVVPGLGKFYVDEGADFIKDVLRRGEIWEPDIVKVMTQLSRPGGTMIDAGAHIGTHTVTLSQIAGPDGRVYTFEPQKKLFRELAQNLRLNGCDNVVPLRFALGDSPAVIEMNPVRNHNEGATSIGSGGDSAELRTLDSFGFHNVSFIKIDVESFELHVLRGAARTIAEDRPVLLVEVQGGSNFDNAMPDVRKKIVSTIQAIEAMGYWVFRVSVYDYVGLPLPEVPSH